MKANIKASLYRTLIVLLLAFVVAAMSFIILGKPSIKHLYTGDEIARFRPTLVHGLIQLMGETFLVIVTCIIARKWLKVRL